MPDDMPIDQAPTDETEVAFFFGQKDDDTTFGLRKYLASQLAHAVGFSAADKGKFPIVDGNGDYTTLAPGATGAIPKITAGTLAYLGPGTAGHVLTSTGTDIVYSAVNQQLLASSGAVSGAATIDFTSGFSSDFDTYIFQMFGVYPSTDTASIRCVISENAGSSYHSTNYVNSGLSATTPSTIAVLTGSGISQAFFQLTEQMDNVAASSMSGTLTLLAATTKASVSSQSSGLYYDAASAVANFQSGYRATTARVNGVRFLASSGNINATKILMYGVKNT